MDNNKIIQEIEEYISNNTEKEAILRRIQSKIQEINEQLDSKFSLVFMAEKGAGKTTTIDFLLGLTYENKKINEKTKKMQIIEEDVLETGSGATTTSEVIICQSDDLISKIYVESYEKEEVLDILKTFSKIIFANVYDTEANDQLAPELLRACRNMSGLTEKKNLEERIDQAVELAKTYSEDNFDAFVDDVIKRCNLDSRSSVEFVYDGIGVEREWIKKTFRKINLVHLPNSPLPKRITVKLSELIFDFSKFNGIDKIVDTRGLELGTNTDRSDIKNIFKSGENNILLFIDKFNSPSKSIIDLLDHYVYDHDMDIIERIGYVVNFRDGEPIKVIGCDGVVEDEEEGILEKRNQAIQIFKDNDVKLKTENIIYCNPRRHLDEDGKIKISVEELEEYDYEKDVITKIKKDERVNERNLFVDNVIGFVDDYQEKLSEELEKAINSFNEIKEEVQDTAMLDIAEAKQMIENDPIDVEIGEKAEEIFDEYIGNKFPSTLSAINNRYGIYGYHDIYCEAANQVDSFLKTKFKNFKDKVITVLKANIKNENHEREVKFLVKDINKFLFKYIESTNEHFYNKLKEEVFNKEKENAFWLTAQRRWGKGAGYRNSILVMYKEQLQKKKIIKVVEQDVKLFIQGYKKGLIDILENKLDEKDSLGLQLEMPEIKELSKVVKKNTNIVDKDIKPLKVNIKKEDDDKITDSLFDMELVENGYEVKEYVGFNDSEINIPSLYKGQPVVSLGENLFSTNKHIKKVTFGKNIKIVKEEAFNTCNELEEVNLNNGLEIIAPSVFAHCPKIVKCKLPDTIKFIDEYAFNSTSIKTLTIPASMKYIPVSAFANCTNLKKVTLHNNIVAISRSAFYNCKNLTEINIPTSVKLMGNTVFQECISLKEITVPDSVEILGDDIFTVQKRFQIDGRYKVTYYKVPLSDLRIKCNARTAIQKYAKEKNLNFINANCEFKSTTTLEDTKYSMKLKLSEGFTLFEKVSDEKLQKVVTKLKEEGYKFKYSRGNIYFDEMIKESEFDNILSKIGVQDAWSYSSLRGKMIDMAGKLY